MYFSNESYFYIISPPTSIPNIPHPRKTKVKGKNETSQDLNWAIWAGRRTKKRKPTHTCWKEKGKAHARGKRVVFRFCRLTRARREARVQSRISDTLVPGSRKVKLARPNLLAGLGHACPLAKPSAQAWPDKTSSCVRSV